MRVVHIRHRPASTIDDLHLETGEHLPHMCLRRGFVAIGCEPVIHGDCTFIRHDIAGDAACNCHGLQPLAEPQSVDFRSAR